MSSLKLSSVSKPVEPLGAVNIALGRRLGALVGLRLAERSPLKFIDTSTSRILPRPEYSQCSPCEACHARRTPLTKGSWSALHSGISDDGSREGTNSAQVATTGVIGEQRMMIAASRIPLLVIVGRPLNVTTLYDKAPASETTTENGEEDVASFFWLFFLVFFLAFFAK